MALADDDDPVVTQSTLKTLAQVSKGKAFDKLELYDFAMAPRASKLSSIINNMKQSRLKLIRIKKKKSEAEPPPPEPFESNFYAKFISGCEGKALRALTTLQVQSTYCILTKTKN